MRNNKHGFTMAELLVVVGIISVLVSISIVMYFGELERTREETDLNSVRNYHAKVMSAAYANDVNESCYITAEQVYRSTKFKLEQTKNDWQNEKIMTELEKLGEVIGTPQGSGTAYVEYHPIARKVYICFGDVIVPNSDPTPVPTSPIVEPTGEPTAAPTAPIVNPTDGPTPTPTMEEIVEQQMLGQLTITNGSTQVMDLGGAIASNKAEVILSILAEEGYEGTILLRGETLDNSYAKNICNAVGIGQHSLEKLVIVSLDGKEESERVKNEEFEALQYIYYKTKIGNKDYMVLLGYRQVTVKVTEVIKKNGEMKVTKVSFDVSDADTAATWTIVEQPTG